MAKTIVIYHGNCADGFTAAWVVRKFLQGQTAEVNMEDVEFIAGIYQKPVPLEKIAEANVIMIDFSYKRPEMEQIAAAAKHFIWIDHHKSALLDMAAWLQATRLGDDSICPANVITYCDNERSGAGLAWDYFFPETDRPQLINLVEDRDLWKFRYAVTRDIAAYMFSFNYDFATWDKFAIDFDYGDRVDAAIAEGRAIERKHFKDINELLPICTRHIRIAGVVVPCANLPYTMVSDAGNILAERNPTLFGICYYDGMDGRNFSLRSVDGGMDVSEIAKVFGGGGHAKAAGFRVSRRAAEQFEID